MVCSFASGSSSASLTTLSGPFSMCYVFPIHVADSSTLKYTLTTRLQLVSFEIIGLIDGKDDVVDVEANSGSPIKLCDIDLVWYVNKSGT